MLHSLQSLQPEHNQQPALLVCPYIGVVLDKQILLSEISAMLSDNPVHLKREFYHPVFQLFGSFWSSLYSAYMLPDVSTSAKIPALH